MQSILWDYSVYSLSHLFWSHLLGTVPGYLEIGAPDPQRGSMTHESLKSRITHYPEEAHNPLLTLATHCRAIPKKPDNRLINLVTTYFNSMYKPSIEWPCQLLLLFQSWRQHMVSNPDAAILYTGSDIHGPPHPQQRKLFIRSQSLELCRWPLLPQRSFCFAEQATNQNSNTKQPHLFSRE